MTLVSDYFFSVIEETDPFRFSSVNGVGSLILVSDSFYLIYLVAAEAMTYASVFFCFIQ